MTDKERKGFHERCFDAYDGAMMKGANAAVRAFNWTTGGTKTELAKGLQTAGFVLWGGAGIMAFPPGLIIAGVSGFLNKELGELFDETKRAEESTKDSDVKNINAEADKRVYKILGPGVLAVAGAMAAGTYPCLSKMSSEREYRTNILFSAPPVVGTALIGSSFYVMRAEDLSPRKNCVRRGIGRLSEIVQSYKAKPVRVGVRE